MKFITQAAKVLNEQKKYKRRLAVFLCLAIVVALGTAAALKMYGQAMSHKQKKLVCQYAAHAHTDGCFDGEDVVCGYADYAVHLHNDDCYGPNGELVCHLPEAEAHVHTEECYTEQEVLICEEKEAPAHEHTEGCYTPERGELSCQMEEHMHEDSCYGENGEIICPLEEHQHDDNCYQWKELLTCTLGAHEHTQDCYTREMRELSCTLEEHEHGEACYDEHGELVCQTEEHAAHDDGCYEWEDVLTCQLEESDGGHEHGEGCYEMQNVLSCGKLELHIHDDSCCDENGALVCGLLQLEEHVHGEDCFETVELTEEEIIALSGAGEESVSGDAVSEDSVSGGSVSADDAKEAHDHTDECYDAAGGLICGYEEAEEPSITKTFEDEDGRYIVTASYYEKAEIPEEAELKAEMITAESNGEHFAQRESEVRETLEDESVSMNALFKIGFYVEEEEVEPKDDVSVTVQFLDEDGFADGSPIAVVHFAEDGSKVLNGGKAKDKSTTFKTNSFSEFGIVDGYEVEEAEPAAEDGIIPVSESFEYEDDAYHITFHIDGKVSISGNSENSADIEKDDTSEENDSVVSEDQTDEKPISEDETNGQGKVENMSSDSTDDGKEENDFSDQEFEFHIETLEKDSEEYAVIDSYLEELDESAGLLKVQALDYSLTYGGEELALDNCEVTAKITAKGKLAQYITTDDAEKKETEATSVKVAAIEISEDGEVNELDTASLTHRQPSMTVALTSQRMALAASAEFNFTVEYYAYLQIPETHSEPLATSDTGGAINSSIEIIDTSASSNGVATLPNNKVTPKTTNLYLNKSTESGRIGKKYDVAYKDDSDSLTEIYKSEIYNFSSYPEIVNFNKFEPEDKTKKHYNLKEVWKQEGNSWKKYTYSDELKLTNGSEFINESNKDKMILIEEDTVIRLVAEKNSGSYNNGVSFYDYDITDGKKYKDAKLTQAYAEAEYGNGTGTGEVYANTNRQGINKGNNYQVNDNRPLFGFGNNNTNGTGLNCELWTDDNNVKNLFNIANIVGDNTPQGYGRCCFGLVQNELGQSGSDKVPVFNVNAPDLFSSYDQNSDEKKGENVVVGKTTLSDYNLNFDRQGDTYTLISVSHDGIGVNSAQELNRFQWRTNWSKTQDMWSNLFWPMDSSEATYGTAGHDLRFGDESKKAIRKAVGTGTTVNSKNAPNQETSKEPSPFPTSDDGNIDHNCFFGMNFSVNFQLTEDYLGPLNYYFFGDDDMWVYLDNQLVCDIGGVHPSIGEYVDLWDYIDKGDTALHTLRFFYTERGASGSTCWMQFTLPSASAGPINIPTGHSKNTLKVGKTVEGEPTNKKFDFTITLKDKNGNTLLRGFNYVIQNEDGRTEEEGSIASGGTFKLGDKQSILIKGLPEGATYTIQEKKYPGYDPEMTVTTGGTIEADRIVEGTIDWERDDEVDYNNKSVPYELPSTGGIGTVIYTIAGAFCVILSMGFVYRRKLKGQQR